MYHQQGAQLGHPNQKQFAFGENKKNHPFLKSCIQYELALRSDDKTSLAEVTVVNVVENAIPFCFKESTLSKKSGSELKLTVFFN